MIFSFGKELNTFLEDTNIDFISAFRHSGPVKKSKDGPDKKLSKKQKSIIAQAGLKTLKKAK